MVGIITSKQQKFSQSDPVLTPIFKKIAVRSSPDPAKIDFSPDPVLIRAHLWSQVLSSTVDLLPKGLKFEHGGAQVVSCSGRHLTSLRPCWLHQSEQP